MIKKILVLALFALAAQAQEDCDEYCCIDDVCCGEGTSWNGSQCVSGGNGGGNTALDTCTDIVCAGAECCGEGTAVADDLTRVALADGTPSCLCVAVTDPPAPAPTPKPTFLSF